MTSINLRSSRSSNRFGSREDEEAHDAKCRAIAKSMKVQFQVAPGAVVTTPSGKVLRDGEEVSASMLSGAAQVPWAIIRGWVDQGLVIEADVVGGTDDDGPKAA